MRRGVVFLWLSLSFALVTVLLLLLFYFFFVQLQPLGEILIADSVTTVSHTVLTNYLNAQAVAPGGERINFADLLRIAWTRTRDPCNAQDEYSLAFQQQTKEFLRNSVLPYLYISKTAKEETRTQVSTYPLLLICTKTPAQDADCIAVLDPTGKTQCAYQGGLDIKALKNRASTFVPVSNTGEMLYLALLQGYRV